MQLRIFTLLAIIVAAAAMASGMPTMAVKESVSAPSQWVRRSAAPDEAMLPLRIGLRQKRGEALESKLLDLADPNSPNYAQWLSQDQMSSYLAPDEKSLKAVRSWLESHDVTEDYQKRSVSGDWIHTEIPVMKAREMLGGADFAVWEHRETGEQIIRTTEYSLPRHLHDHIDLIGNTVYFGKPRALRAPAVEIEWMPEGWKPAAIGDTISRVTAGIASKADTSKSTSDVPASCNTTKTTNECLREYYGTDKYTVQKPNSQFIGISGFLEEYASYADLSQFLSTERPDAAKANYKFSFESIDGGLNTQSDPGTEANLDVQTVAGVAFNIPSTYYSTAGRPPFKADLSTPNNTNEPYASEFEYLLNKKNIPSIITTSYGDDEQTVPASYQKRVCREIAALGSRGTTLFFSSGDAGVGTDGKCYSNDGKNKYKFLPAFPASCPYATTVGATEAFKTERAVSEAIGGYYGGGGFSELFPAPAYQKDVVDGYVKSLNGLHKGLYNTKGRAYPDLSAQGSRFLIVVGNRYGTVGGTSASSPLTASIFALINDMRLAKGKPTLGFINPALYQGKGATGLKDITVGSNNGCNTTGFPAKKGWDAATGWGTPEFSTLVKAFV